MKFLFIAPRFHTNQVPIIELLLEYGHSVQFFSIYKGATEDYSSVRPLILKSSLLTVLKSMKYKDCQGNNKENIYLKEFRPSIIDLLSKMSARKPDIVIIRGNHITLKYAKIACKILGVKVVLVYTQDPLYVRKNRLKLASKRYLTLCIPIFTPVLTNNISDYLQDKHLYCPHPRLNHIPFIVNVDRHASKRMYFFGNKINVLSVGKYRERKNHFLLVDAIDLLKRKNRNEISVTIVGQVSNIDEKRYFTDLSKYIIHKNLDSIIRLEANYRHKNMSELYQKNDVFVLASKKEAAAISILEAMANGLVTISTDDNGTASYIDIGKSGFYFKTMDPIALSEIIEYLILNKHNIPNMGNNALNHVKQNYAFMNYYSKLACLIKREFDVELPLLEFRRQSVEQTLRGCE